LTLHVYEKVELELGPLLPGPDSVFRCPVRLFLDPSCPLRYLASHSAGLHQVKKADLELGPLLPGPDSVFRCPVRLFLDPSCPLCSRVVDPDPGSGSGLDPYSIGSVDPDPDSESGSRRAKMTHKSRQQFVKVHILKCWMASFES
jgi:hypothetical protein